MRKRDFLIFILCGIGLFIMLQQEGTVSMEKAFFLPLKQPLNLIDAIQHELAEHEVVDVTNEQNIDQYIDFGYFFFFQLMVQKRTKPLVTDMDGDGSNELIIASRIDEGRTPMVRLFTLLKYKNRPRYVANDFSFITPVV